MYCFWFFPRFRMVYLGAGACAVDHIALRGRRKHTDNHTMTKNNNRVCCLYRVSTDKQVDFNSNHEADLPMQRKACHKFAESKGWVIVHEEQEEGVSGHKVRAAARDKLQIIKDYDELISYADLYDSANFEAKKMIVNQLIRRVDVYRGYQINISFNFDLTPYIEGE